MEIGAMVNIACPVMKINTLIFWMSLLVGFASCSKNERKGRDSYLDAYSESHGHTSQRIEYSEPPDEIYASPVYDPHTHTYEAPKPYTSEYYESPAPVYGPPVTPVYGPPTTSMTYGPPDPGSKGMQFGIDFGLLCKILLKILIFKMIVKFIAIICVLLFLPKLTTSSSSSDSDSNNDMERNFSISNGKKIDDRINRLTRFVLESVDKNSRLEINKECSNDFFCKIKRTAEYIDERNTVPRLFKMFLTEAKNNDNIKRRKFDTS
ncbi:hypothetical protein C0J52_15107 [Blattella germanica]|nr:hypothetical protein C0J52_15107 [Blattella germanica]